MELSNRQIKLIRSLHRKKFRKREGLFIIEGLKILDYVVRSPLKIELLVLTPSNQNLLEVYTDIPVALTNEKTFAQLSSQSTPSGVLAMVQIPDRPPAPETFGNLTLMLDTINDPGNLGTIVRTADWFGIRNVICSEDTVDIYNPKTIQSTMGSIARVNVYYHQLPPLLEQMSDQFTIMGLFMQGEPLQGQKSNKRTLIVTGNEANGISKSVRNHIQKSVSISGFSDENHTGPESLNASIATGIACYELTKRD